MKCVICKNGETTKGKTTVTLEHGGSIIVIKGVTAGICDNCGEYYLDQKPQRRFYKKPMKLIKRGLKLRLSTFHNSSL